MASLLDPWGLWGRAFDAAQTGARMGAKVVGWAGDQLLGTLGGPAQDRPAARELGTGAGREAGQPVQPQDLASKMRSLQSRAIQQSTSASQNELFHRILDQLTPDEARILGALSDGSSSPLINVRGWSRSGTAGRPVLENASLVGRTANLALPLLTPVYVGHLLALGLLEIGPEDPSLKEEYQILGAESAVLKAIKEASRGPLPARVERQTVMLSGLGQALWRATMGEEA